MKPPVTGQLLRQQVESLSFEDVPIVEDFFYKGDVLMIASDAGTGKSAVLIQLAMSLTSATPIFGLMKVPSPVRVYYFQLEGSESETYRRMRFMQEVVPWNEEFLCIDNGMKGIFLQPGSHSLEDVLLKRVSDFKPEVVIIDPIYKIARIRADDGALALIHLSDRMSVECGTSNIFSHHTHRASRDPAALEEDDPFYGSSFIKNHVSTSYLLYQPNKLTPNKPILDCKKDRGTNVLKKIKLQYHPETFTCSYASDVASLNKTEAIESFLRDCIRDGKNTSASEICSKVGCSTALLRKVSCNINKRLGISIVKSVGKDNIWKCV